MLRWACSTWNIAPELPGVPTRQAWRNRHVPRGTFALAWGGGISGLANPSCCEGEELLLYLECTKNERGLSKAEEFFWVFFGTLLQAPNCKLQSAKCKLGMPKVAALAALGFFHFPSTFNCNLHFAICTLQFAIGVRFMLPLALFFRPPPVVGFHRRTPEPSDAGHGTADLSKRKRHR